MKASILIVSRNRKNELRKTLLILKNYINLDCCEILVFLDGCTDDSWSLKKVFPWVNWLGSQETLGASKARNILFKNAKGKIFIGFDDDAHPLHSDFIEISQALFDENPGIGIIAYKEVKGVFDSYETIPKDDLLEKKDFYVNDFLGCGFAIKKNVYNKTRGFPLWIDIYGEEMCVALETLELGYDILYTHKVMVNHRVDMKLRKSEGANYYRFGKQLKNTSFFYLVYYPFPMVLQKLGKLYFHNFKKYGLKNNIFFKEYISAFWQMCKNMRMVMKYRRPISKKTLDIFNNLPKPYY